MHIKLRLLKSHNFIEIVSIKDDQFVKGILMHL